MCKNTYNLDNFYSTDKRCKECAKQRTKTQRSLMSPDKVFLLRWANAKFRAERDGLEFSINVDDVKNQYISQNGICFYTGNKMDVKNLPWKSNGSSISIDRVDSNKGYTVENIVLCENFVNRMKGNLSQKEFFGLCETITKFSMMRNNNTGE